MGNDADKQVTKNIFMFGLGLVIMMVVLIILANKLMDDSVAKQGKDDSAQKAAAERIQPVGKVNVGAAKAAAIDADAIVATCAGCHGSGALGSPKIGSKADWAPRLKAGFASLLKNAMNGKGSMPAQKGAYSEKEITAAIKLMLKKSGL